MTKWVAPCKIVELTETTLKIIHVDRPDDPGELIKRIDPNAPAWPQSWVELFENESIVAISIDRFQVLIEPYNLFKHGAKIEISVTYDPDENARAWFEDLIAEWAESRGLSRDDTQLLT